MHNAELTQLSLAREVPSVALLFINVNFWIDHERFYHNDSEFQRSHVSLDHIYFGRDLSFSNAQFDQVQSSLNGSLLQHLFLANAVTTYRITCPVSIFWHQILSRGT
jgi:hypothetical protein